MFRKGKKWRQCTELLINIGTAIPTNQMPSLPNSIVGPVIYVALVCYPDSSIPFSLKWASFLCCRIAGCRSCRMLSTPQAICYFLSHHIHSHQLSLCLVQILPEILFPRFLLASSLTPFTSLLTGCLPNKASPSHVISNWTCAQQPLCWSTFTFSHCT